MMTEQEQPPASKPVERVCSTCVHVNTCKAFAMANSMDKSFSDAIKFVKLIEKPELLAKGCTEYISPIPKPDLGV